MRMSVFVRLSWKLLLLSTIIFLSSNYVAAQEISVKKGIELYNNKLYVSAINEFDKIINNTLGDNLSGTYKVNMAEVTGYKLLCKIMLKHSDISGSVREYEYKYPYSFLLPQIKFRQAILYFDNGNFSESGKVLNEINRSTLAKREQDEYDFRKAYCLMRIGDNNGAKNIFNNIINPDRTTKSTYIHPALYYLGYIHYINKDFANAIPFFERAKEDARFTALSNYHALESKFMLKDYKYVITNGGTVYEAISDDYKPKVARILSESYYALNEPAKAKYYYEIYSINSSTITKNDTFYSGMISYTLNSYISAIDAFTKVASTTDSIGQSAYYHMGQCYIQLKNKHAAQEAFQYAAQSNFDKSIQEDAYFNYAKLAFDLNRDIVPFTDYLTSYPMDGIKWDDIHGYMSTAFLLNKNYTQAIEMLNKIKRVDPSVTIKLQKAAFFRGMQLIESGSYKDAIEYLKTSIKNGNYNTPLLNLSQFWLAECYYRGNRFKESLDILVLLNRSGAFKQTAEYPVSVYNKAYSRFKLGDFSGAIEDFKTYIDFPYTRRKYTAEAQTRLADCYFMTKDYERAAELFERIAIDDNYSNLYAPLQGAIAYGLLSDDTKKMALLNEITSSRHQNSPLYSTAIYEMGRTLVQNVKDGEAEKVLNKLIDNPKDSTYYYKALLELGMINSNLQKPEEALKYYKTIVAKKPISEEAQSALAGIENIYSSMNKSDEYINYLDNIGLSTTKTAGEKESMLFNSAEQIFLGGNYNTALNALTSFVNKYPTGNYAQQANFYIAECYYKMGKLEYAADAYYKVMMGGEGASSEVATMNYGKISYQLERYPQAIKAYETLSKIAILSNNKLEAQVGKMRSYYKDKQYETAVIESNQLLAQSNIDKELKQEANYIKAKSLLALGEREGAIALLKELAKKPMDKEGAEAAYLLIMDAYDTGNFTSVEKQVFALSDSKTPQAYWLARSFIVLGDSYAERGNYEQAKATFNSITENYKPEEKGDNINELVTIRLKKLK
ncbi:MAG: tetratricopeptide repeat protein [Bacteroidales bacterium]